MLDDKIRVFSSDKIELTPCNADRAYSLVRKNKARFINIGKQERAIILNKSSEQTKAKGGLK